MKFALLLTNYRRVHWLWWGLAAYIGGIIELISLHFSLSFWAMIGFLPALMVALIWYDKLFRQQGWVLIEADGIAWANPADNPPESRQFEEIRAYRFELYRNGIQLLLYLHDGQKVKLDASFSPGYAAMQQAFSQAVRRYNQARSAALVTQEKTFFERPVSSKILLGLLVASAAWIAWNISQQATAAAYFPVVLVLVPYLGTWAAYSGRRE